MAKKIIINLSKWPYNPAHKTVGWPTRSLKASWSSKLATMILPLRSRKEGHGTCCIRPKLIKFRSSTKESEASGFNQKVLIKDRQSNLALLRLARKKGDKKTPVRHSSVHNNMQSSLRLVQTISMMILDQVNLWKWSLIHRILKRRIKGPLNALIMQNKVKRAAIIKDIPIGTMPKTRWWQPRSTLIAKRLHQAPSLDPKQISIITVREVHQMKVQQAEIG